ncbi:MAG: F0F1 ATP synthase subunit epsilon [Haliscomenobacter sp.]
MMHLTMLTPEQEIFKGNVQSVKVPGVNGQFQILNNHAPIVSALEKGTVVVVTATGENLYLDSESGGIRMTDQSGKQLKFQITGGFIEVLQNTISLLVQGLH